MGKSESSAEEEMMAQLVKMPLPRPTQEELEAAGASMIRKHKRSELLRRIMFYGSAAALFGLGMLTEYLLRQ